MATLTAVVEWGVRHHGHFGRMDAVDKCKDEARARRYQHALLYCGNADAVLVHRDAADAAWIPMGGAS